MIWLVRGILALAVLGWSVGLLRIERRRRNPVWSLGRDSEAVGPGVKISVIIPARNEVDNLSACLDCVLAQDHLAWVGQGPIMDRSLEKLGESDTGLILYRKLLQEQMAVVQDGGEPMNMFRGPVSEQDFSLPQERWGHLAPDANLAEQARYGSKLRGTLEELLARSAATTTAPASL